jgi:hypothetical protein
MFFEHIISHDIHIVERGNPNRGLEVKYVPSQFGPEFKGVSHEFEDFFGHKSIVPFLERITQSKLLNPVD